MSAFSVFKEKDQWRNWVKEHEVPVTLSSDGDADLAFLDEYVKDKRIVLLGENGHGIAEHNEIRVRMIRYLHAKLGFRVLAFESGLADCGFAGPGSRRHCTRMKRSWCGPITATFRKTSAAGSASSPWARSCRRGFGHRPTRSGSS